MQSCSALADSAHGVPSVFPEWFALAQQPSIVASSAAQGVTEVTRVKVSIENSKMMLDRRRKTNVFGV